MWSHNASVLLGLELVLICCPQPIGFPLNTCFLVTSWIYLLVRVVKWIHLPGCEYINTNASFIGPVIGKSIDAGTPQEGHYRPIPIADPIIGASLLSRINYSQAIQIQGVQIYLQTNLHQQPPVSFSHTSCRDNNVSRFQGGGVGRIGKGGQGGTLRSSST